jgi:hypothetical protein
VLLSEREWPSAERERVVSEGEDRNEQQQRASPCEKKTTLGGNQRRRVLRNERIQLGHQQRRCILTSTRL